MATTPAYDSSGNPIPTTKSTPWLKWIGLGCGGALILVVLLIVALVFVVRQATAGPEVAVKEFLEAAAGGDYAKAHDYFSAPLKQAQPLEVFTNGVKNNPVLFQVEDTTFSSRSVDMSGAELSGTLTLKAGTQVPASFKLVKENGDWKLISYSIGS
jgi:hypothetical protein